MVHEVALADATIKAKEIDKLLFARQPLATRRTFKFCTRARLYRRRFVKRGFKAKDVNTKRMRDMVIPDVFRKTISGEQFLLYNSMEEDPGKMSSVYSR